jgi:ribosome-associated toxin RatA of RatAB toxin-antitoxin module
VNIHFNDTQPANASAETLFDVLTDYPNYPSFNSAIVNTTVLGKDESGAEFLADRKTRIGKEAHAFDRYERNGDLVIERTYEGVDGSSTWTVHAVDADHSTLTIDGTMTVSLIRGLVMKVVMKRILYGMDFKPFIEEAERRAKL